MVTNNTRIRLNVQRKIVFLLTCVIIILASCQTKEVDNKPFFSLGVHNLKSQFFIIEPAKGGVLCTQEGTVFSIPPHCFTDSLGNKVTGKVNVEVKIADRWNKIVMSGLETLAKGDSLLSTGGMFYIDAKQDSTQLLLTPGKEIFVSLPTTNKDPNMHLFYAKANSQEVMRWEQIGTQGGKWKKNCGKELKKNDPKAYKKCRSCLQMVEKMAKVKVEKKNIAKNPDEWFNNRYAWDQDSMFFFTSGEKTFLFTKEMLEECKAFVEHDKRIAELFKQTENIKKEQVKAAASFYEFKLNRLGWFNCDKYRNETLISFNGILQDENGDPVIGNVHILSKDEKIHNFVTTTENGQFKLQFLPNKEFELYAFSGKKLGKTKLSIRTDNSNIPNFVISPVDEKVFETFMESLNTAI